MEVKNLVLLSTLSESMEYREVKNPYGNPTTREVTTKLIVLYDKTDEMYEIIAPGEITRETYRKGQESDFKECSVRWNTSGKKGFNPGEVGAVSNVTIKTAKVVVEGAPSFPNEKENAESVRLENKQAVRK